MADVWRALNFEQRVAAVGASLLVVSTFGPFSFVEAAIALTGIAVLALLRARARRLEFHLPFGDGTVIMAAGAWAALLIIVRLLDRPLGQSVLALACAAILAGAGARERAKRPADDLPPPPPPRVPPAPREAVGPAAAKPAPEPADAPPGQPPEAEQLTLKLPPSEEPTAKLPPDPPR